jgi:tRNA pseudouridine65 synthase
MTRQTIRPEPVLPSPHPRQEPGVGAETSAVSHIPVLYRDDWYVVVDKPPDLLVHHSGMAPKSLPDLVSILQDQVGKKVYPVHRLDRKTSGLLVLALSSEAAGKLSALFEARLVAKTYLAVVRGWLDPTDGQIDRPLSQLPGEPVRAARTRYITIATTEVPIPSGRHPTSRYSFLEVNPETGRRQQIRRHFAGMAHPIIGDGSHGDKEHNRIFREYYQCPRLLLLATRVRFLHPFSGRQLTVKCAPDQATGFLLTRLFPGAEKALDQSGFLFRPENSSRPP